MRDDNLIDGHRLAALRDTGLLDGEREPVLDRMSRNVAEAVGAPVALVSLVDADRQFFAGLHGLPAPWDEVR